MAKLAAAPGLRRTQRFVRVVEASQALDDARSRVRTPRYLSASNRNELLKQWRDVSDEVERAATVLQRVREGLFESEEGAQSLVTHAVRVDFGITTPQRAGLFVSYLGDLLLLCHLAAGGVAPQGPIVVSLHMASPLEGVLAGSVADPKSVATAIETLALIGSKRKTAKAAAAVAEATVESLALQAQAEARIKVAEAVKQEELAKQESLKTLKDLLDFGRDLGDANITAAVVGEIRERLGLASPEEHPLALAAAARIEQLGEMVEELEVATVVDQ